MSLVLDRLMVKLCKWNSVQCTSPVLKVFFHFSSSSISICSLSSMICLAASFKLFTLFCNVCWCGKTIFSSCAILNNALTLLCRFAFTWARYGEQLICAWIPAFLTRLALELSVLLKDVNTPL